MTHTLVTWNVAGLDDRRLDERSEAACLAMLLRPDAPTVICLQELVGRSWHAHFKHHLHHAGYLVVPEVPDQVTESSYFCALAVHRSLAVTDFGVIPLQSRMGRTLVWAAAGGFWFGTSHFESERAGTPLRQAQAALAIDLVAKAPGPAVFAGDTNLRATDAKALPELAQVVDAFDAVGRPKDASVTWTFGQGAQQRSSGARFDRIWHNHHVVTETLRTEGADREHSDHLSVWATLRRAGTR